MPKVLDQVVSEGVEVIDDKDHLSSLSRLVNGTHIWEGSVSNGDCCKSGSRSNSFNLVIIIVLAMRFTVVIATIRQSLPGFDETMERIESTFTEPTDFHILDGSEGKAQALNKASDEILASAVAECYVTMDDDIVPSTGWQESVCNAFEDLPKYGAFGLWMGDSAERLSLVGSQCLEPESRKGSTAFRRVRPPHHINGGFIAYRTHVAQKLGHIPTGGVKYQLWEDAWRGRTVTNLGWEMAFVMGGAVDMVEFPDKEEYLAMKSQDLRLGKEISDSVLAKSGCGDSNTLRLRKWVAKLRGRA